MYPYRIPSVRPTLEKLLSLDGRLALVTGALGHIGNEVCRTLLEQGARVWGVDLPLEERHAPPCHESTVYRSCDLSSEEAIRELVREFRRQENRLDILVHSAAFVGTTECPGWGAPFDNQSVEAWNAAWALNVTAPFLLVQQMADLLRISGKATVILVGSIYGEVGPDPSLYEGTEMVNPVGYGATKGGLRMLSRYLAVELSPQVRVNYLRLGGVYRKQPDMFVDRYEKKTPMKRMAQESDVAGAVAYLASDLSSYVTGQDLGVDGGWTIW